MQSGDWYDTAQICLNGHLVNDMVVSSPDRSQKFCSKCGAATVTQCPQCSSPIKGFHHMRNVIHFSYHMPDYCYECGAPYPWMTTKLEAVTELAEMQLSEQDAEIIKTNLDDIVRETPRSQVAAHKVKQVLTKSGQIVGQGLYKLIVDIASETATKVLTGPH